MSQSVKSLIFGGKYKIGKPLKKGSQGTVYFVDACNVIKLEVANENSSLPFEASCYEKLAGTTGIVDCKYFGEEHGHYALVLEFLPLNLEQVFCPNNPETRLFQQDNLAPAISHVGALALEALKSIHTRGILHCDIKPSNFCLGRWPDGTPRLCMIDFGLAKQLSLVVSSEEKATVPGNLYYASLSMMADRRKTLFISDSTYTSLTPVTKDPTKADDLESLAYMLISLFYHGETPWYDDMFDYIFGRFLECHGSIFEAKKNFTHSSMVKDVPSVFQEFLVHAQQLDRAEEPDYDRFIIAFKGVIGDSTSPLDRMILDAT
ncbi:hypothetical protein AX17_004913 [Amanita inopinata Kibby_2008]|nr:hypothetical protein AX17_004913 [Amanita inopinata Kibby_2008]